VNEESYSDVTVMPESTYYYRVRSVNSFGESAYTSEVMATTPAAPTGGAILGNTDIFDRVSTNVNRRAVPYTMPEAGDIESICIYHEGGSGGLLLGVYGDDGGLPSGRLGVTPLSSINSSGGWQTVHLSSPVSVSAGETIWLAWGFENNPGIPYQNGSPGRAVSPEDWGGGMPIDFGSSSVSDYIYSIYANYDRAPAQQQSQSIMLESGDEIFDGDVVLVYPNPTTGKLTVSWKQDYEKGLALRLLDATGRTIQILNIESGLYEVELDLRDYRPGMYLLILSDPAEDKILFRSKVIRSR